MTATNWKSWLVPGGLLVVLAAILVNGPLLARVAPSLGLFYFLVFAAGLLLAWRFHSSRLLFSLLVLLLAHRAVEFFSNGQSKAGPGRTAVLVVALLVPLNFIVLAWMRERGLVLAGVAPRFGLLFLQSVVVAVLCRPEVRPGSPPSSGWMPIPWWALCSFVAAAVWLGLRFFRTHRPIEPGSLWALVAILLWLCSGPVGKTADAYVATAGLVLVASLIETSYVLAYHDELTGIPGRRAFNEALPSLDGQYAIAIVDIDHFKRFNDTYGHDVGDQVLRMVATRLAAVGGSGKAYRCGGEEFAIIFRETSARDAYSILDVLRKVIEDSSFRMRGTERRTAPRPSEPDRRRPARKKMSQSQIDSGDEDLSVTVSIGVAEPSTRWRDPEQVIQAADAALYEAKRGGRNRVERAGTTPQRALRSRRLKAAK